MDPNLRRLLKSNPKTKKLMMAKCNELNINFYEMIKDFSKFTNYILRTESYTNDNLVMMWELYTRTKNRPEVEDSKPDIIDNL